MDTVILAAGRGERLNGIVPRYHKPLVLVNGQPLIRRAAQIARDVARGRVVVVAAPQNAAVLSEILDGIDAWIVLQREPTGPGDGLLIGLELTTTREVLVLMADNVLTPEDVSEVVRTEPFGVGVQELPASKDVERFTRWENGSWVEKEPLKDYSGVITAWVGPVTINGPEAKRTLPEMYEAFHVAGERPIGPYLGYIAPDVQLVHVSTVDIGTAEAVAQ